MRKALLFLVSLLALTAAGDAARAARHSGNTRFGEGTWVVLVGRITSDPNSTTDDKKMQVGIGPKKVDYTLHMSSAVMRSLKGKDLHQDRLDHGKWVRAEGRVMDDPRRIKVNRLKVVGQKTRTSLTGTPYYRKGFPLGYIQNIR